MSKSLSIRWVLGLLAVCIFAFSLVRSDVQAQTISISDEQVTEQRNLVMIRIADTMQEQIKLLQMLLIKRLEIKVQELQAELAIQ